MIARLVNKRLAIGWDGNTNRPIHSDVKPVLIIQDSSVTDEGRALKWQYPVTGDLEITELLARHGLTREVLEVA